MRRKFWSHQLQAWRYTRDVRHPYLAMEMRLGKTLVAIRRILTYKPAIGRWLRVLCVMPSSCIRSWVRELEREGQTPCVPAGPSKQRLTQIVEEQRAERNAWVLLNKEAHLHIPEIASLWWDVVLLDEATFIKNPRAKVTKFFCNNFRGTSHRWCLAGIPNPESDLDVFCQFQFLHNTFLHCRDYWSFRQRYFQPVGYEWLPRNGTQKRVHAEVARRAFVLRRRDVRLDRKRVYEVRSVRMPRQSCAWKAYRAAEDEFITPQGPVKHYVSVYSVMRDICNGFVGERFVWDEKIREIVDLKKENFRREPIIVWVARNNVIAPLEERLQREGFTCANITGEVPLDERTRILDAFNQSRISVLILQVQCAAFGMNLSRAAAAVYYDVPDGLLARVQSEDRILSITDASPLLFIDIVVEDTIDEDRHQMIVRKQVKQIVTSDAIKYAQERRARDEHEVNRRH